MVDDKEKIKSEAALREERILEFWRENKIFEKSLEKEAPKGKYVFYDGPPFATGTPHYGHILGSTVKDVIGRYQTMRGYRVPRRWGWDCHGLPIENIVEKDLGISGKKMIEELGIGKFVVHARSKVLTYVSEWEKTIHRIGRWVDFENSYKTMDNTFIESVWWALGELKNKDLLYEGVRVLAYCPRCETPIANSEIAMDNSYKDITDISVYVKFKLKDEENTYLLAWTTTPWTLPGNTAIAVHQDVDYVYVSSGEEGKREILIVAKDRFVLLKDKFVNGEILKEVKGSALLGLSYEPIFPYFENVDLPNKENIWKVWHADFVTLDMGTGLAHEAPAFGEDDMNLAKRHNIPFIRHVEPNGVFAKEVSDFAGVKVKPKEDHQSGDVLIIKYLAHSGKLLAKEKIIHSYPHCYRCETPLLYYALPSWFVNIQKTKNSLLKNAKSMNWIPEYLKEGRFRNIMESAPDWTISRNRYWASPLPFWKSVSGKVIFVNSVEDLKSKTKKSGNRYFVMRHGEAENNTLDVVSCDSLNPHHLTEKGREQVKEAVALLEDKKIDLIFVSPFLRTRETAETVAKELGYLPEEIKIDKRLAEINDGSFNGKSIKEIEDYFQGNHLSRYDGSAPGGESLVEVKKRVAEFLYEVDKNHQNKNILVITHEDTGYAFLSVINGLDKKGTQKEESRHFLNAEIRQLEFIPFPYNENYELDLHRPYIDSITLVGEDGEEYKRVSEVVDCWFESGSMPFAQDHYPFENPDWKKNNFPSGFVAEYIAQTRTWFYYTHVISSILFDKAPFRNIVTTGTILAEDGQKMSKSKNNFPDPALLFDKYGVDALRFYLMNCPLMKGGDINFSEKSVQEVSSKIISRLENVLVFYELYREEEVEKVSHHLSRRADVLDKWIVARLDELISEATLGMEKYDMSLAIRPFELFIEDLSTWYLRRSRERIKDGDKEAKETLYFVLKTLAKLLAPFTPFTAENIWLRLKNKEDKESVHLASWPRRSFKLFFFLKPKVIDNMEIVRKIVTLGLEARQRAGIKVRQPLNQIEIIAGGLSQSYLDIIKSELNVKNINYILKIKIGIYKVNFDLNITPELKEEGDYRELGRALQDMRKKMGLTPSDVVSVVFETDDNGRALIQKFENDMKKTVMVSKIEFKNNDGEEIKIDELIFKVKIEK